MRTDLSELSSMKEITDAVEDLGRRKRALQDTYLRAALLDPDYIKLHAQEQTALYYMRLKGCFTGDK